jgi:hypothetical protein
MNLFYSPQGGMSTGVIGSAGGFVGGPGFGAAFPAGGTDYPGGYPNLALGGYADVGAGAFITNASSPKALNGPFATTGFNLQIAEFSIGGQIQVGSNGVFVLSATFGGGGGTMFSAYSYQTTTASIQVGCE